MRLLSHMDEIRRRGRVCILLIVYLCVHACASVRVGGECCVVRARACVRAYVRMCVVCHDCVRVRLRAQMYAR